MALVEHLLELGHRRVGMLTGLAGLSTTGERLHGYLRAHEALGHPVDKQLIVCGALHRGRRPVRREHPAAAAAAGRRRSSAATTR